MGVTKTDFVRGMQCPKMLWLDRHKPELKEIPPEVREKLDQGNDYGDRMMGMFGPFTEVQEYYPETKWPDRVRMAAKTAELIAAGTRIICEAAFMDGNGNYCAVDILRWDDENNCYDMYEVKYATEITDRFVQDAAFQAYLIRRTGLKLGRVFIVHHSDEPYDIEEVTKTVERYAPWVDENIDRLGRIKDQPDEVMCEMGVQCACPYECWYYGYCRALTKKERCSS
jgi:hypothetical protein